LASRDDKRKRRHFRIRKKVSGTAERPRLCVFRSHNHIYAQIIDDMQGHTLVSASSLNGDFKDYEGHRGNIQAARKVGELVAKKALEKGIRKVVFDRGGYLYHGRVKALAEAAREAGLEF
jgi:large subunit ribosomal protein L18